MPVSLASEDRNWFLRCRLLYVLAWMLSGICWQVHRALFVYSPRFKSVLFCNAFRARTWYSSILAARCSIVNFSHVCHNTQPEGQLQSGTIFQPGPWNPRLTTCTQDTIQQGAIALVYDIKYNQYFPRPG